METKLINYENLEKIMVQIENIISDYKVDERELIIKNVAERIQKEKMKMRDSDIMDRAMEKLNIKKMIGKITGRDENG